MKLFSVIFFTALSPALSQDPVSQSDVLYDCVIDNCPEDQESCAIDCAKELFRGSFENNLYPIILDISREKCDDLFVEHVLDCYMRNFFPSGDLFFLRTFSTCAQISQKLQDECLNPEYSQALFVERCIIANCPDDKESCAKECAYKLFRENVDVFFPNILAISRDKCDDFFVRHVNDCYTESLETTLDIANFVLCAEIREELQNNCLEQKFEEVEENLGTCTANLSISSCRQTCNDKTFVRPKESEKCEKCCVVNEPPTCACKKTKNFIVIYQKKKNIQFQKINRNQKNSVSRQRTILLELEEMRIYIMYHGPYPFFL